MNGSYICKHCGKAFKSNMALNGHQAQCKENPNYVPCRSSNRKNSTEWNYVHKGEIHTCEYCGKQMGYYKYVQHRIRCKENPNRINIADGSSSGVKKYWEDVKSGKRERKPINQYIKAEELGLPKPIVSDETRGKLSKAGKGRKWSTEGKKKISDKLKQYYKEHPDEVPYKLHHSSKPSYPEEYFKDVFNKENIDLKYHLRIDRYELDFYNIQLKKYVEIDGSQHERGFMIEHDKIREKYLKELVWEGIRINWSDYQKLSHDEKCKVIKNIREFLLKENKYIAQANIEQIYISYKDKKDKEREEHVKLFKEKQLEHKKHMREILIKCCETSNIDFTKRGWIAKSTHWIMDNIGEKVTHVDKLFKRHYPEFYELYNPYVLTH